MGNRFSGGLNQDYFQAGERPLWVVSGLTTSVIECPLFHTNYYDNWAKRSSSWMGLPCKPQEIYRQMTAQEQREAVISNYRNSGHFCPKCYPNCYPNEKTT